MTGSVLNFHNQPENDRTMRSNAPFLNFLEHYSCGLALTSELALSSHYQPDGFISLNTNHWKEEEDAILMRHYPSATREELLRLLPTRSYQAIKCHANRLHIRRAAIDKGELAYTFCLLDLEIMEQYGLSEEQVRQEEGANLLTWSAIMTILSETAPANCSRGTNVGMIAWRVGYSNEETLAATSTTT